MNNERLPYLLKLIAENDDQLAFDEFITHFFPGLLSYSVSIIKNEQSAEEVVEDVFFRIWQQRATLPSLQNVTHYLYVSTKNASLRYLTKKAHLIDKNTVSLEGLASLTAFEYSVPGDDLISLEAIANINRIISELPPKRQLIFRLIKEEELTYHEVADLLDISIKTVEAQMLIAFKAIARVLSHDLPEYKQFYSRNLKRK